MGMIFMAKVCEQLVDAKIVAPDQIIGCSPEEIREIEACVKGELPESYIRFLCMMGRSAGDFFKGTDIFYPRVLGNRQAAEELLVETGSPFKLSKSDFVFSTHQGYQFWYFDVAHPSDDPPVYYYSEGKISSEKIWESFSNFMLESVEDHIRYFLPDGGDTSPQSEAV